MSLPKLTKEQAVVISAYTGFLACNFRDMHEAVEKRLGRSVWTHEFGSEEMSAEIREAFKDDFLAMIPVEVVEERERRRAELEIEQIDEDTRRRYDGTLGEDEA